MIDLNRFPHYTIAGFLDAKRDRRDAWKAVGGITLAFFLAFTPILVSIAWNAYHHPKPSLVEPTIVHLPNGNTFFISGSGEAYGEDHVTEEDSPVVVKALNEAVAVWRKALPGKNVAMPRLLKADHCSSSSAVACADMKNYTIRIVRINQMWDLQTIMLHEMGHLLGVPHIEGDALMDAMFSGKVDAPTPAAIALAKLQP